MKIQGVKIFKALMGGLGRNKHLVTISFSCYLLSVGFKRLERYNVTVSLSAGTVNLC